MDEHVLKLIAHAAGGSEEARKEGVVQLGLWIEDSARLGNERQLDHVDEVIRELFLLLGRERSGSVRGALLWAIGKGGRVTTVLGPLIDFAADNPNIGSEEARQWLVSLENLLTSEGSVSAELLRRAKAICSSTPIFREPGELIEIQARVMANIDEALTE